MSGVEQLMTERRHHERLNSPQLYVRLGESIYRTVEWSFGGFVIECADESFAVGALVRVDGVADERAYRRAQPPLYVDIRARVIRAEPETGRVAFTCLHLDDMAYRILADIRDGVQLEAEA